MAKQKSGPEGRRLHFDDEDAKIYENLIKSHGPFKGLNYIDIFSIAAVIGKKAGFRTELKPEGKSIGRVVESVIDNSELRYLMKAIAVEEEDSLGVILDFFLFPRVFIFVVVVVVALFVFNRLPRVH